jgi:catechol 2,3-dioxygenase-like lactoylglutathione lyase family enzyme
MPDNDRASSENRGRISPTKFAHFVVRTTPECFEEMVQWYRNLLNAEIVFQNPFSCFMTYDSEHHRVAIIAIPGLVERPDNAVGVDHVAFTFANIGDLLFTYERLAAQGITPAMPMHHGPTLSMYYQDPQKNQVELQIDVFETADETDAFLKSEAFARNPIGVMFDPAELSKRHREGVPEAELIAPLDGPPPGPFDWPAH